MAPSAAAINNHSDTSRHEPYLQPIYSTSWGESPDSLSPCFMLSFSPRKYSSLSTSELL